MSVGREGWARRREMGTTMNNDVKGHKIVGKRWQALRNRICEHRLRLWRRIETSIDPATNANNAALATANPPADRPARLPGARRAGAPLRSGSGLRGKPRGQQIFSAARRPRASRSLLAAIEERDHRRVQDRPGDRRRSGRVGGSFADVRLGRESSPGIFEAATAAAAGHRGVDEPLIGSWSGQAARLGPATFAGGSFLRPEVHLRRILRLMVGFEVGGVGGETSSAGNDARRELAHAGVIGAGRVVVALPLHGDAVLRARQLVLEIAEVLAGLQIGIPLGNQQQVGPGPPPTRRRP